MDDDDGLSVAETGSKGIATRRTIVYTGNSNKLPKDQAFSKVFQFCEIEVGLGNTVFFTKIAGCFSDFLDILDLYPNSFARAVILLLENEPLPDRERLKKVPLPWEALRVFSDGRFSRILEDGECAVSDRDRRIRMEEMFE